MDDIKIDQNAMAKLAKALAFICGADHAATLALKKAGETGADKDIKAARAAFLKLKTSDRNAAFAMIAD